MHWNAGRCPLGRKKIIRVLYVRTCIYINVCIYIPGHDLRGSLRRVSRGRAFLFYFKIFFFLIFLRNVTITRMLRRWCANWNEIKRWRGRRREAKVPSQSEKLNSLFVSVKWFWNKNGRLRMRAKWIERTFWIFERRVKNFSVRYRTTRKAALKKKKMFVS